MLIKRKGVTREVSENKFNNKFRGQGYEIVKPITKSKITEDSKVVEELKVTTNKSKAKK